ncbi:Ff.00g040200.m01.CDS01 [Fusarium sp. VM40]|nr:Ff.00g040200.m01.CDS01 [Fusarium sp. VM40]
MSIILIDSPFALFNAGVFIPQYSSVLSTTDDASATPSTVVETTVEISVSSSKTSAFSVEVSDSSVPIETSATPATRDFTTDHTTAEPSTTDLTTTAAIPTFTMFASGSNVIAGKSLQSYSLDSAVVIFDPATDDNNPSFLCGYYRTTNDELNKPATVITCHGETPLQSAFFTYELSSSFGISCSVPAISCTPSGSPDTPPACVVAAGTWSLNSVGVRAFGHTWQIGNSETPVLVSV